MFTQYWRENQLLADSVCRARDDSEEPSRSKSEFVVLAGSVFQITPCFYEGPANTTLHPPKNPPKIPKSAFCLLALNWAFNTPTCLVFKANQMWDEAPRTSLEEHPHISIWGQRPLKHLAVGTLLCTAASDTTHEKGFSTDSWVCHRCYSINLWNLECSWSALHMHLQKS